MRAIPRILLNAVKDPKLPDISIGRIYLIIRGINVLNNPAHIPWNTLAIMNNIILGMRVKRFDINPITVVIIRHYLYTITYYLREFNLINIKAIRHPMPPPKNTEPVRSPLARLGSIFILNILARLLN